VSAQLTIDDYPARARRSDPDTSHEAAARVHVGNLEAIVLAELRNGSATSAELAERTGIDRVAVSPRLRPLARKGLIQETALRRNGSIVWVAL